MQKNVKSKANCRQEHSQLQARTSQDKRFRADGESAGVPADGPSVDGENGIRGRRLHGEVARRYCQGHDVGNGEAHGVQESSLDVNDYSMVSHSVVIFREKVLCRAMNSFPFSWM